MKRSYFFPHSSVGKKAYTLTASPFLLPPRFRSLFGRGNRRRRGRAIWPKRCTVFFFSMFFAHSPDSRGEGCFSVCTRKYVGASIVYYKKKKKKIDGYREYFFYEVLFQAWRVVDVCLKVDTVAPRHTKLIWKSINTKYIWNYKKINQYIILNLEPFRSSFLIRKYID